MDPIPNSWESAAGFVAEFCALGGTVESRAPLLAQTVPRGAAADRRLGAQLARDVDGTMLISTVSNAAAFLRAYERPRGRLPQRLVLKGFAFAQPGGLSPGGLDLSGVVLGGDVPTDSERPQWVRQREAYARAFPKLPPTWAPLELAPYMGAEALARALEHIDGDVGPRGRRLQEALSGVAFEGPAGPVRLDPNRQAILAVHLRRIAGSGEQAVTEPFRVVPEVDQSFGGAFRARTPAPSFESPKCRRGRVPAWAAD